jgi:hypothetical protein
MIKRFKLQSTFCAESLIFYFYGWQLKWCHNIYTPVAAEVRKKNYPCKWCVKWTVGSSCKLRDICNTTFKRSGASQNLQIQRQRCSSRVERYFKVDEISLFSKRTWLLVASGLPDFFHTIYQKEAKIY